MINSNLSVVIMAAGKGTRLNSELPKVLHEINGKASLFHVIDLAKNFSNEIIAIVGYKKEEVISSVSKHYPTVLFAIQEPQLGTAHAVQCASPKVSNEYMLILSGDVPALSIDTVQKLVNETVLNGFEVGFIAAKVKEPAEYGRVILDEKKQAIKVIEAINCSENERKIDLINSGVYIIKKDFFDKSSKEIKKDGIKGEFYLPDVISLGYQQSKSTLIITENEIEVLGFNTKEQLEMLNSKLV
ncbi:NTP transferase domain-containing protein [bacterium]|nr:NTP transferase domain-containing protein [bacterium]